MLLSQAFIWYQLIYCAVICEYMLQICVSERDRHSLCYGLEEIRTIAAIKQYQLIINTAQFTSNINSDINGIF